MENNFIDLTSLSIAKLKRHLPSDEEIHIVRPVFCTNSILVVTDKTLYTIKAELKDDKWELKCLLRSIPLEKIESVEFEKSLMDSKLILVTEERKVSIEFDLIVSFDKTERMLHKLEDMLSAVHRHKIRIKINSKGLLKAFGIGKEMVKTSIEQAKKSIEQAKKNIEEVEGSGQGKVDKAKQTIISKSEVYEEKEPLITNKYETIREIGRGGMGIVYEALNKKLGKKVALKKMKEELAINPREKEKFLQEARRVAQLHHPNIVDIYDVIEEEIPLNPPFSKGEERAKSPHSPLYQRGEIEGGIWLVFEYVDGKTIEQVLNAAGKYGLTEAVEIIKQVCDALKYAHGRRIVHRDIKPSNIIMDDNGIAKVMDFGIAREAKDTFSRITGKDTSGTLAYMAPEQELGSYSEQSDIFSVGVCLYEMLTGELPFKGPNFYLQKEKMIYRKIREMIPEIPEKLETLIDKCLQPEKEKRYDTLEKLLEDLKSIGG